MEALEMDQIPIEPSSLDIVQDQPRRQNDRNNRRRISISTVETASSSNYPLMMGLDFLRNNNQFIIQQTMELLDLMSTASSECRYTVKIPRGDTIYFASESSTSFQRNCFGSGRSFTMRLYDRVQQEVVQFQRRLACGNFTCCCYLQQLDVLLPPGELIGVVSQNWRLFNTSFNVYNSHNQVLYRIEGAPSFGCILGKGANFQIYTPDGSTQIGSIIYQWDHLQVAYNLLLQMPGNLTNDQHKALLLGAAFLLEYMFFQKSRSKCTCSC